MLSCWHHKLQVVSSEALSLAVNPQVDELRVISDGGATTNFRGEKQNSKFNDNTFKESEKS